MVKCVKTGKRRSICNCGGEKCGGCLCKKSGKEKVVCNCGGEKCGGNLCKETGKRKIRCKCGAKECSGSICKKTGKDKSKCDCGSKNCGGGRCKETGKIRNMCNCGAKNCGGGRCKETGQQKRICRCGTKTCGSSFCIHGKIECRICDMTSYLISRCRSRINKAVKNKRKKTIEYLGCDIETFKKHIENQFKEGMSWENYGKWHIDHIIPIYYKKTETKEEEILKRLNYKNTQPLWAEENIKKGNLYIG